MLDLILWVPEWMFAVGVVVAPILLLAFSFFSSGLPVFTPVRKIVVNGILIAAFSFSLHGIGVHHAHAKMEAEAAEARLAVAAAEALAAETNVQVITQWVDRVRVVEGKSVERIKYVDRYITKEDDAVCRIGERFGVLHDSAANNTVPSTADLDRAAKQDAQTPSSIALSDVARTIDHNYAEYYKLQEEVNLWRSWYNKHKQIFDNLNNNTYKDRQ